MRAIDQERTEALEELQVIMMESERTPAGSKPHEKYTTILWNKKPTLFVARTIIFFIFFIQGILQAYQNAIILDLQERGATYDDQAFFSLTLYPFIVKIVQAPFIDTYYVKWLGKCKTYIISSFLVITVVLFFLAPYGDEIIQPKNVKPLTFLWMGVNVICIFSQIAGEMWIVKIFSEAEKGKGTIMFDIGMKVGAFVGYNLFIPLNSPKFLNKYFFTSSPISEPLVSHAQLLIFIGIVCLGSALYILGFVAESIPEETERPSLMRVLKTVPKFFTTKAIFTFLLVIGAGRLLRYMFMETLLLKLLDSGVKKTTLVNIDTLTFPVYIGASIYMMRYIHKGNVMKTFWIINLILCAVLMCRFLIYIDLANNHSYYRSIFLLVLVSLADKFIIIDICVLGFVNFITPESIGSTFITFVMCWNNAFNVIPTSIGLKLVNNKLIRVDYLILFSIILRSEWTI